MFKAKAEKDACSDQKHRTENGLLTAELSDFPISLCIELFDFRICVDV